MTKGKRVCKISGHPKEDLWQAFPLIWSVCRKRKERKDTTRLGSLCLKFKSKIEFVCKDFENLSKIDSRGFKHDQKVKAKG
jgi:hypothetical protein